jgi:hypothetical protein
MKNIRTALALTATALGLASSAQAGFTNGGFELGNTSGWFIEHGRNGGSNNFVTTVGSPDVLIVGTGYVDPYSPFDGTLNGNYSLRVNDFASGNEAVRISQTGVMTAGETSVFVNWAAVMEEPGHATGQDPFFSILVKKNGTQIAFEQQSAGAGTGWTLGGPGPNGGSFSPVYYKAGTFAVTGLNTGDSVEVIMTVLDCSLGGHAGWAYLDGIGTTQEPNSAVPDGGMTATLFGAVFAGLVALRRKL